MKGKLWEDFLGEIRYFLAIIIGAYPNHCFVGLIFSSDQYKFVQSPEDYYKGKMVRIKGKIEEYQSKPEIILKSPDQIEIGL